MNNEEIIGEFIKRLRKEKKMTIADLHNSSGVSQSFISQVENGMRTPSPDILGKLAEPLGVSKYYLLFVAGYLDSDDLDTLTFHISSNYRSLASTEKLISRIQSKMEEYPPSHPSRKYYEDELNKYQEKRIKFTKELEELLSEERKSREIEAEKAANRDANGKQRIHLNDDNEGNFIFLKNNMELPEVIQEKLRALIKLTLD